MVKPDQDTGSARAEKVGTWAAAVIAALALAGLQLSFSGLFDLDSYFHARAAIDLAQNGPQLEFPQAAFSTWATEYSDKDFLFHVLIAPFFADGDLDAGGKYAVILINLILCFSLAYSVRSLGLRFGAVWVLLLIGVSTYFVGRLVPLRPHPLGLAFVAVEIALLVRNRPIALFVVSALHVLAHSSFPLVLGLYGIWFLVSVVQRTPIPWRTGIAATAGVVVASLAHPYFPNNFQITYAIARLLGHLWGVATDIPAAAFGSELRPMAMRTFLLAAPGWAPALLALVATVAVRGVHRWPGRDLFLLVSTLTLLGFAFASKRFLDMFILSAILLAGALWTTLAEGRSLRAIVTEKPVFGGGSIALVSACLLTGLGLAWSELPGKFAAQNYGSVFKLTVDRLDGLAEPGDVVYHPSWREFSVLYGFRPEGRYISGLDPVFLHEYDPKLFKKNWLLSRGFSKRPYGVVAREFGAKWIFVTTDNRFVAFRRLLARTPGIDRVYDGTFAEIWAVQPPPAAPQLPGAS